MHELHGVQIYCNHSRRELRERSECARDARTARALGRRDLLRSLEMRELRERSECAICRNHSNYESSELHEIETALAARDVQTA